MNTMQEQSVVVGVFSESCEAQKAICDLKAAGFQEDHIGVVSRHTDPATIRRAQEIETETDVAIGAGVGAVAGAGIGAMWAIGIASMGIPAVGPVLVGGSILAAILASTWGGSALGSILGVLIGLGIPKHEAAYYERQIQEGRTVVTVYAEGRAEETWNILSRRGAFNVHYEPELVALPADEPAGVEGEHVAV
jgi:hypothetical protein